MFKKIVLSLIAILGIATSAFAQKQVSGKVVDAQGQPLPGVAVFVAGTSVGTVTDAKGAYTLNIRGGGDELQFTFFGMKNVNVAINGQSTINVTMEEDALKLDEVVVTATGMTRQEKTLGYASTTVRSDEITKGHSADVLSGLAGKVAGLQISSAGATGTSQKVIVRGYSSLTGSNQPLYVIDGIPQSNSAMGVMDLNNAVDFGNQAADINPEDVESVTILKGASATALYGSRAANGAIIITTKKGLQNEDIKVTYSGSFMANSILRIPQTQRMFGQGWGYDHDYWSYYGNYAAMENGSWGNLLDGRSVEWRPGASWYNGAEPSYTTFDYKKNSLKNFYSTGFEANNNISIQGGSKTTGFVASYGNIYSNGILPGNGDVYRRHNFSFRGNTKIKDGLAWFNYGINFVHKEGRSNMSGQGGSGSTIFNDILQYPVNLDYAQLKDYHNIYNNADNFYTPYAQNPWWTLDHNYSTYEENRVYGNLEFGVQLCKGLQFITRAGADFSNSIEKDYNDIWTFNNVSYAADQGGSAENGSYSEYAFRNSQVDANFLLNADYRFGAADQWSLHGVLGWNVNQRNSGYLQGELTGVAIENFPSFSNSSGAQSVATSYAQLRRLVGLYAQADLGWKDAIYLTLSARNDWSSTLPVNANSFFYWGVNASVIFTELFPDMKNDVLSFLKLRGGYGQTGNDASPYMTAAYYLSASVDQGFGSLVMPLNGHTGYTKSTRLPSSDLKPEISTEVEAGVDARFFDNRLGFDLAYYNKRTANQIVAADLAAETGFRSAVRNIGLIRNYGVELAVNAIPVKTKDFQWNIGYTFSKNISRVQALWDDVQEYGLYYLTTGPQLNATVGGAFGVWSDYKIATVTDEKSPYYGKTIVDSATGYPNYDTTQREVLGNADPDFTMGLNNTFKYKNFSLGFSFDWRHGGLMYSATKSIMLFTGNDESTTFNKRDAWIWPNSVVEVYDAAGNVTGYAENSVPVDAYYFINGVHYDNYNYMAYRNDMLDKSYLKLRELNLTYSLPRKWFANISWLTGIDVSFIGRNLFMWTPSQGIIDPDTTNYGNDTDTLFGEFYAAPSTRSLGGSIKIVF